MSLGLLSVRNLRCIRAAELELEANSNLIYGQNAAGKTSLLEAVFLLGCGRSFRTAQLGPLVRGGADEFVVSGRVDLSGGGITVSIRGGPTGGEAKLDGRVASSRAQLALSLPVQVLGPEVHKLVEEGPSLRRQYLDWGVFHMEHSFREAWKRYNRALKQRNTALRGRHPAKQVKLWDQELVEQGVHIAACRTRYTAALQRFVDDQEPMLGYPVKLTHLSGWRPDVAFHEALEAAWSADVKRGLTTVGPHRADVAIIAGGMGVKGTVSRGQQKMLAAALILAQQAHRTALGMTPACLLVDDPAAELDVDNLGKLLRALSAAPAQLIVTALTPTVVQGHLSSKLFHVKQGVLQ